jgi:tRNA(fMet)-specific endonuclease VapC
VGEDLILETTFLIDLERELRKGGGPAHRFLDGHRAQRLFVTFTVAGELAAGTSLAERAHWEEFLSPFRVLPCTMDVCWEHGRAYRYLQQNGLLIGGNDLWIAATAVAHALPVVTRNVRHYRRVPGLSVAEYAPRD